MGRRRFAEPRKRVNVYINERLLDEIRIIHFDPAREKIDFGVVSNLVNILLEKHLQELKASKGKGTQNG